LEQKYQLKESNQGNGLENLLDERSSVCDFLINQHVVESERLVYDNFCVNDSNNQEFETNNQEFETNNQEFERPSYDNFCVNETNNQEFETNNQEFERPSYDNFCVNETNNQEFETNNQENAELDRHIEKTLQENDEFFRNLKEHLNEITSSDENEDSVGVTMVKCIGVGGKWKQTSKRSVKRGFIRSLYERVNEGRDLEWVDNDGIRIVTTERKSRKYTQSNLSAHGFKSNLGVYSHPHFYRGNDANWTKISKKIK
jgi:hypothetical protein